MKKIAHRIHENHSWLSPTERLLNTFWAQGQIKSKFERMTSRSTEAFRETLGVTVVAAAADLGATRDGIPGCVSPFDRRRICHGLTLERVIVVSQSKVCAA